jgi:hypothetical protein
MIFSLFKGASVATVESRIHKLLEEKAKIKDVISEAVADRAAALRTIQDETVKLTSLVKHVS